MTELAPTPEWVGNLLDISGLLAYRYDMVNAVKKRVTLLGSTGSIGKSSLSVLAALCDRFELTAVAGGSQWQLLANQARKYNLQKVLIADESKKSDLEKALVDTDCTVMGGEDAMVNLACDPDCDILIVAVVGAAALPAVLAATKAGKTIAIANKESLVVAGCLLMPLAKQYGATILPVDSEHSAILQAMHAGEPHEVDKVIITSSGGPFRTWSAEQIAAATLDDALNHPTWNMGPKISIDSATMMNKALEVIEARWLFDLDVDRIEVLVHPESIVHSLVEFRDGSVIAQLAAPDMQLPIQYALTFPERLAGPARRLNLGQLGQLNFEVPDVKRFPGLKLGFDVAAAGGSAGAVFNAANEAAVDAFRAGCIGFGQIAQQVKASLDAHHWIAQPNLSELLEADSWARRTVGEKTGMSVTQKQRG